MYQSITKFTIRYGETDQMGYVYYGNYALFCEVGRVDLFKSLGVTYKELENFGVIMPVIFYESKYIRPAFYDDEISLKTIIKELPSERIEFFYEFYNKDNKIINVSKTKLVFLDIKTRKKIPMPDILISKLTPFFKENNS